MHDVPIKNINFSVPFYMIDIVTVFLQIAYYIIYVCFNGFFAKFLPIILTELIISTPFW